MTPNAPAAELHSPQKEGRRILEEKAKQKAAIQRQLGWPEESKRAIVCLPLGMTDELGGRLLKEMLPGLLTLPVEILIRGKGTAAYGKLFTELAKTHSHRIAIIPNQDSAVRHMLQASDMALFLHAPEMSDVLPCLAAGAVPLCPAADMLEDYNPNQETGNAFTYAQENPWHAFAACVRSMETFRFPYDWRTIQLHGFEAAGL
jgi:starch synthase